MKWLLVIFALFPVACSRGHSGVVATITPEVLVKDVIPFGVNLGSWTFWGAEQLMSNIIKNPGFEGVVDGAIVLPVHSGAGNFDDSPEWLARPDAFWEGARYSIRNGIHAGEGGTVSHSVLKNAAGLPTFTVKGNGTLPEPGDVVALSKSREDVVPTQWWFSRDAGNLFAAERIQVRPGSPGSRSLRVSAGAGNPAEVASYLDTIGDRAGKLLPLKGKWTLSFWAKRDRGQVSLRARVGRDGAEPVLNQAIALSGTWTNFVIPFDAGRDSGPPEQISLKFRVAGEIAGDVLLDDVDLRRDDDKSSSFRKEVIATLKTLHPSYLRDWQGQLGDTLANRTASTFARKAWRYRPGDDTVTEFGYGLGEFLQLAQEVGASPWIVVPTVFTDEECAGLGTWLAAPGRLAPDREILAEFGNENWNELFRPAGISDPVLQGQVADRCLAAVRAHAPHIKLKTIVNAQFANAAMVASYGAESQAADIVAVSPYFAFSMPAGLNPDRRNQLLFEDREKTLLRISKEVRAVHKELAVAEVNLHTTSGTALAAERQSMVAGVTSGAAIAYVMLESLAHGMRRQCVYTLAGYDSALQSVKGHVPLWGIVRDLVESNRFRPTGLALQLLNETVTGVMRRVELAGANDVWVYAFESQGKISAVVISGSEASQHVRVNFPADGRVPASMNAVSMYPVSAASADQDAPAVEVRQTPAAVINGSVSVDIAPGRMMVLREGLR